MKLKKSKAAKRELKRAIHEPFFTFASSPKLEVKFSNDAVAKIRTNVGEGDTVEFQLCRRPNGGFVAQEISVKEKAKKERNSLWYRCFSV